ncbi:hypothetical protein HRG_004292 [Hirsutella rhossiliensis]|uniref:Uncharacterized protein n=1 Tax=Hirsutella rhossiliensis TaxID=111463 RepID=A0A9P8MZ30_9HYPO|nr:uncharacterized protein HRG_04292 [Hirsutella rhossiliensis]KAH0963864.1 hypothetical protein HRG_04292 [Hirsutella rhossiliensis]
MKFFTIATLFAAAALAAPSADTVQSNDVEKRSDESLSKRGGYYYGHYYDDDWYCDYYDDDCWDYYYGPGHQVSDTVTVLVIAAVPMATVAVPVAVPVVTVTVPVAVPMVTVTVPVATITTKGRGRLICPVTAFFSPR